jgi:hypothetical protein
MTAELVACHVRSWACSDAPSMADSRRTRYGGRAEVHVLLRNPQVELVPCRQRHHGPGVTDTSKTMEGGTST